MLRHPLPLGQLQERPEVVDVRVDAAVGDEPEQVDVRAALLRALEGPHERRVLEQLTAFDRDIDTHQVLEEDTARSDRQVADLRVAHLPRREADRLARGLQARVRELGPEPVEHRGVRQLDCIARPGRRAAPPVQDDQRYEVAPERQIAMNESSSSEAPPTSAPSTLGWRRSSSALSGLTEPP